MGAERRGQGIQLLELRLQAAHTEEAPGEVIQLLEWRIAKARHEQAQLVRHFAHQHGRALLVLAARLVGYRDAQDVAQDAFLSLMKLITKKPLLEARALLGSVEDLLRLMYRITSCRAYDCLRRRSRREGCTEVIDDIETLAVETGACPETAEQIERLDRAYAALPPAQRIAHVLHYYYGFSDADFEATLGLTKSNSRTLVRRANLALRRAMESRR